MLIFMCIRSDVSKGLYADIYGIPKRQDVLYNDVQGAYGVNINMYQSVPY